MTTEPYPTSIELTDDQSVLRMVWSDGITQRIPLDLLRSQCPCAACRGHHPSQSLNLKPEQFPGIRIVELTPAGNYAYQIKWSDNHETGIYTLQFLRELGG